MYTTASCYFPSAGQLGGCCWNLFRPWAGGKVVGSTCRAYDYDPEKMGKAEAVQEAPAITIKPDPSAMLPGHAHGAAAQARLIKAYMETQHGHNRLHREKTIPHLCSRLPAWEAVSNMARGGQADMRDVRTATVAAFRHIFETDDVLHGIERRQALKDWVDLLAASHPLDMCATVTQCSLALQLA